MIEDCVVVLHESIQNNVQYDYVINDLTEFPVDKTVKGESSWVIKMDMQFLKYIIKNIFIEILGLSVAPQKGLIPLFCTSDDVFAGFQSQGVDPSLACTYAV